MSTPRLNIRTEKRTPHYEVERIKERLSLNNILSVPSNKHLFKKPTFPFKGKPISEMC